MYDRHLDTFIQTADCGSFMKAAEKLYISPNAVTKQINLLEQDLDLKLFQRSSRGLVLTEAGKLVYNEAKKIIKLSNAVLQKAHELEERQEYNIRVGVSLMNSSRILLEEWGKAANLHPNMKLQIIPYEDEASIFYDIISHWGKRIDVIACSYDSTLWEDSCNSFHLRDLPICIAAPVGHPLSAKEKLNVSDLYGHTLITAKRENSVHFDRVRDYLEQEHPRIKIMDVDYYDLNTFNQVASDRQLLLSAECWDGVHPLLKTIPVEWDFTVPYGLLYAKEPSKEVLQFIMTIGKV